MKYTNDAALAEILRRGEQIVRRRERRTRRALSGATGLLFAALALIIGLAPEKHAADINDSVYGAFLLPSEAGGYVLAAVLAFVIGVAVTLIIVHRRRQNHAGDDKKEKE